MSTRPPPADLESAIRIVEEWLEHAPIDVRIAWNRVRGDRAPRRRTTQPFERVAPERARVFTRPIPREEPE